LILPIGVFPYMTFWDKTSTDLFHLYPPSAMVDGARLLLSFAMLLTFPMPFFSCRELLVLLLPKSWWVETGSEESKGTSATPLIPDQLSTIQGGLPSEEVGSSLPSPMLAGVYHILLTVILWGTTVVLALSAPSLGDVLNLVGCATGTMISFILPGLFAFQLEGFSWTAFWLLVVGGTVGIMGTYFSFLHLFHPTRQS